MKICFFTMANAERTVWVRRLISSGAAVDRPIWFYRIPKDHPDPKRYKIDLLASDLLPEADKYVYIDADSIMAKRGDWEADDCWGAKHESWTTPLKYSNVFKGKEGWPEFCQLHEDQGSPKRLNSGLIVIPADLRKKLASVWQEWNDRIDGLTTQYVWVRDQIGFGFAAAELGIPVLPERFCALCKAEYVTPEHILIHAAGHPSGEALDRYHKVVEKVLGGYLQNQDPLKDGYRWQVLVDLIIRHAENPTYPVAAEIGVFRGETTEKLMKAFPGLRMYGVDSRAPMGPQAKFDQEKIQEVWQELEDKYHDRLTFQQLPGIEATFPEKLDLMFEDSDHRTEMVIAHAHRFWKSIKMGGVYAVHDYGYTGKYYDAEAVKRGMDILFPGAYYTGADKMSWAVKTTENIGGND